MKKIVLIITILVLFLLPTCISSDSIGYAADKKKLVLLELFTAEWCGPCGPANREVDAVYEESGGKDFLLIKFHVSDDMECRLSEQRAIKYGVSGIPKLVVDGKDSIEGYQQNYKSELKSLIQKAKGSKTTTSLEVTGKIIGNKAEITVSFEGVPAEAQLVVVLVEDFYYYRARNGEIIHRFLARNGSSKAIGASGREVFSFEIDNMWAKEMLRCIAFIEDSQSVKNASYTNFELGEPNLNKTVISVIPNEVSIGQVKEGEKIGKELTVTNVGKVDATLKLESKETYINFPYTSLSVSSKTQTKVNFTINTANLTLGLYTSTIKITGEGYSKEVPLKFEVLPKPSLFVSEGALNFGKVKRGERPRLSFEIRNNNKGPIKGTISSKDKWLIISKKSFNEANVNVNVTAITKDLPQGKSKAKIKIESDGGDAEIDVSIEIVAPNLELDPPELDFGKIEIEGKDLSKEIIVKNSGDIATNVEVGSMPDFCEISEKSFSLPTGESKKIKVSLINDKLKLNTLNEGVIIFSFSDEKKELKVSIHPIPAPPVLSLSSEYIKEDKISVSLKKGEKSKIEIELKNSGGSVLDGKIEVEPKVNWISISIKNFSLKRNESKKIFVNLDSNGISPGNYEAKLKFSSNGGSREIILAMEVTRDKIIIELKIGVKVAIVSGKELIVDPPPYIKKGVTLVPLRFISEAFGASVDWKPDIGKGTVIINLESKVIQIEIDNLTAFVNGVPHKLLIPPEITNGRTFVPLRFISEAFGASVEWFASEQRIRIVF